MQWQQKLFIQAIFTWEKNRSNTCCKYPMKRNKMIGIHHWNYNCIYSITSVMQNFSKKKKDPWYSYSKMLNNLNVTPYIKKSWYYKSSWLLVVSFRLKVWTVQCLIRNMNCCLFYVAGLLVAFAYGMFVCVL